MDFRSIKFFENIKISVGNHGAPFVPVTQFQSWLCVHPDHVGFVIGSQGSTIKKIAVDCKCYVKIQDANMFSKGFPWFIIKGSTPVDVCEAFHRLQTIANEAERRLPRINVTDSPNARPRVNLMVKNKLPTPTPPSVVIEVVEKIGKDGKPYLVDEKTSEVYHENGRLVGHWVNGLVMCRSDESD
jgi:hypothetical protein